jgi:hypothetical protein
MAMAILGKSKLNQADDIADMATKVHRNISKVQADIVLCVGIRLNLAT